MIEVSIIIVNYYTSNLINNCIKSIIKHVKNISYEIIIVDNNTEDLSKVINLDNKDNIKLIQLTENVGFGRANNVAVKIASGRNIFFLNPDTLLLNNVVKILSDYLESNKKCGACGGNIVDNYKKPIHSFRRTFPGILDSFIIFTNYNLAKLIWGNNHEYNNTNHPISVSYITGADLMIPKYILDRSGGFDPNFFMYFEETDLCFRIKKLGYEIISVPSAKIIHLVGKSHKEDISESSEININEKMLSIVAASRKYYFRKNNSVISTFISFGILRINYLLRLLIFFLTGKKNKIKLVRSQYQNLDGKT